MEIQLQELINQIKADGVAAAEQEAASKMAAAREEAEKIIADAKAEAEKLLKQSKEESERFTRVSEDAIRQAGRNLLISFRESIAKELTAIAGKQVAQEYSPDVMGQLIPKVVEAWTAKTNAADLTVLLSEKDLKALEETLFAAFKAKTMEGVTLKADDRMTGGFRIAVKDGNAYYDYSAEAVTAMFADYLNPRVAALLKEAEKI